MNAGFDPLSRAGQRFLQVPAWYAFDPRQRHGFPHPQIQSAGIYVFYEKWQASPRWYDYGHVRKRIRQHHGRNPRSAAFAKLLGPRTQLAFRGRYRKGEGWQGSVRQAVRGTPRGLREGQGEDSPDVRSVGGRVRCQLPIAVGVLRRQGVADAVQQVQRDLTRQTREDADSLEARQVEGTPVFTPASPPRGRRNCAQLTEKKRGDGLERRPLVGIARERETSADHAAPYQCEGRTLSQPRMVRRLAPPSTVAKRGVFFRIPVRTSSTATRPRAGRRSGDRGVQARY